MSSLTQFLSAGHNLQHVLAVLLLVSRLRGIHAVRPGGHLGDIGSTYLATPNLKLEGNPLARWGGWKFALLTLLVALLPYVSVDISMAALAMSLLVTGSNFSKGWLARSLGEQGLSEVHELAARRSSLSAAVGFVLASAGAYALAGAVLFVFSGGPDSWAYWFAAGVLAYSFAVALYGTLSAVRLYRRVVDSAPRSG